MDRGRPRAPRGAPAATSKLRAAQSVGLRWRTAGLAAALMAVLVLVVALATGGRASDLAHAGQRIADGAAAMASDAHDLVDGQFADIGFQVSDVHLQGASPMSRDEILKAAAIEPGRPILGLDLGAIRARVERVGWVEHAKVIRLLPGTLVIAVTERPLMAVWEHQGRRDVVAPNGTIMSAVDPSQFRRLPRIIGEGANTAAFAFLPRIESHPRLAARLRALRRVDGRRWDLLLTSGTRVLLPADREAAALATLDRLDGEGRILDLGLDQIDLRKTDFTVVRPKAKAPTAATSQGV